MPSNAWHFLQIMSRFRFILFLLLLGFSLHIFGKNMQKILPMVTNSVFGIESEQKVFPVHLKNPNFSGLQTLSRPLNRMKENWENWQKKRRHTAQNKKKNTPPAEREQKTPDGKPESLFMQITMEDIRPPLKNIFLGEDASQRLELFLQERRKRNTEIAEQTNSLFGKEAQKEVMFLLVKDEKESFTNAKESKSPEEFSDRQQATDVKTQKAIHKIFEKYKQKFNSRLYENSSDWNQFFKQINNFDKAE